MDAKIKLIAQNPTMAFILIPKNGTSTVRNTYNLKNISNLSAYKNPNKKVLAIIRNPFERFITGYIETFIRFDAIKIYPDLKYISKYKDIKNERERLKRFMLDCRGYGVEAHVEHQSNFLQELTPDYLVNFDYMLEDDLETFTKLTNTNYNNLTRGITNPSKKKKEIFKHFDKELMGIYHDVFKDDIEMYFHFLQLRKIKGELINSEDIKYFFNK